MAATYDVNLGPLKFVAPTESVGETIGDGLEVVGAALLGGERKPRPHKLKLAVRGDIGEVEPRAAGLRLRRQLRQLFDNSVWRLQGFYLYWTVDEDHDCWLLIGSALLQEMDPGISFGEFDMELNDVYLAGRPGTHRPGRRLILRDRREGLFERDTRRLLYSADFSAFVTKVAKPLVLPGSIVEPSAEEGEPILTAGPPRRATTLKAWSTAVGVDGATVQYTPDPVKWPPGGGTDRPRFLELDDVGSVKVWDLSAPKTYPPLVSEYVTEEDVAGPLSPLNWERVYGKTLTATHPLAMSNEACRVIWLGATNKLGLAIEFFDFASGKYQRAGRVLHSLNVREQVVVECSPERSVLEWRAGRYVMRAILQRGWWGPRLESYDDAGSTTRLEFAPEGTGATITRTEAAEPKWVWEIKRVTTGPTTRWATQSADEVVDSIPTIIEGPAATFRRTKVLVAQLACVAVSEGGTVPSAAELAALSLTDARAIPVLIGRA